MFDYSLYSGFVHRSLSPALQIHEIPPLLQRYNNRYTQIMAQQFHHRLCQRIPGRNCACSCGKTKPTGGQQAVRIGHDRMRTTRKAHTFRTNNGTSSSGSRTRRYILRQKQYLILKPVLVLNKIQTAYNQLYQLSDFSLARHKWNCIHI